MKIELEEVQSQTDDMLTLTLRAAPETVMKMLAQGLPKETLQEIADGIQRELDKRKEQGE